MEENNNLSNLEHSNDTINNITLGNCRFVVPLEMRWRPKEDITVYELALCLPYFFRSSVMPYEVDTTLSYFRHFEIIDHNKY